VGEMALLRGARRSATVSAQTDMRGLMGGRAAFARLLAIPGVLDKVVAKARQRLAAGMVPVPVTLRDGATVGLRPVYPGDRRWLMQGQEQELVSGTTLYDRFFTAGPVTPAVARYLTEVDYVDHFAWVAVDRAEVSVGGASYVRSASDAALADISFLIMDEFQGRDWERCSWELSPSPPSATASHVFPPTFSQRTRPCAPSSTTPASSGNRRKWGLCTAFLGFPTPASSESCRAPRQR
jgi:hypothetical protein